jgi:FtsH-binding integral membrane protein
VRKLVSVVAVIAWLVAIIAVYRWSETNDGWALANALIVAIFGLGAVAIFLRAVWRAD